MLGSRLATIHAGTEQQGAIVAFHGVTDSAASLTDIAAHYQDSWRVVLVDSLGHGLSQRFNADELAQPFAAAVAAACEVVTQIAQRAFGRQVVLLGHSMGGAIAAQVALCCPQLIRGLVLEDPALLTPAQAQHYQQQAAQTLARQAEVSANLGAEIAKLQAAYPNWSAAEVAGWAQAKTQSDRNFLATGIVGSASREQLAQLRVPSLLLTGDRSDVLWGAAGLAEVAALENPQLQGKLISGASHTVRRDAPAEFFAAVDEFLAALPPVQPAWPARVILDPQIEKELANIPVQHTWQLEVMRKSGAARNAEPVPIPAGFAREILQLGGVESRVFTASDPAASAPQRLLFAIHGGGYVAGKAAYDDVHNLEMMQAYPGTIIVSPEYRLAPEAPYPAALEDCLAAFAAALIRYPDLPVYLYGDSAGAGLVNQMLQQTAVNTQARLKGAIALEPCLSPRLDTPSYLTYANGPVWTATASRHAWEYYYQNLPSQAVAPVDLQIAAKYPPMLIVVNAADPLRDEGIDWALQLTDAGVQVDLQMRAGTYHGALVVPQTTVWEQLKAEIYQFFTQDRFAEKRTAK